MQKRITLLRRRDDRTPEQFGDYWSTTHAAIAKDLPRVTRYLQNHVVGGAEGGVDGVVELWFADDDAAMAGFRSDIADRLVTDEPNFLSGLTGCAYHADGPHAEWPWKVWLLGVGDPVAASAWAASLDGLELLGVTVDRRDLGAPLLLRERLARIDTLPEVAVSIGFATQAAAEAFASTGAAPARFVLAQTLTAREVRIV